MNWKKCSDEMPKNDAQFNVICRSNGKRIWPSNGYALNETKNTKPDLELKWNFIEWIPHTESDWNALDGDKWNATPIGQIPSLDFK